MRKLNEILLIEDDEITNFMNKDLLEGLNIAYEIQVIEDGKEAFEYLSACSEGLVKACPEFVIFDHHMPQMDGPELIKALDEINFIKENKVVFMFLGVSSNPADIESMKELGVQEFATKPLSEKKVIEVYHTYW